ncbi:MAG TPA: RICIN domain-containing protein [Polyangia bacterium]|nr:RICIN domain-containing protein [Polyangia bacterium]
MAKQPRTIIFCLTAALSAGGCVGGSVGGEGSGDPSAVTAGGTIVRNGSAKCLDVAAAGTTDGTKIQQYTCNGTGAQDFLLEAVSGGVKIVNTNSGKCVDLAAAGTANGTKVQLYDCNNTVAQTFVAEASSATGYSQLRNPNSNRCIDVSAASNADGAAVQLYDCNGTAAQQWKISAAAGGGTAGGGGSGGGGGTAGGGGSAGGTTSPTSGTEFAPYFYTWGWGSSDYAFSSLTAMKSAGGPSDVTIAFVLSGGGCTTSTDIQSNLSDVKAFEAAGGHVKASFGGADGTYLESACSSASALASALQGFVDATGITDLDFDIEQGSSTSNSTINAMRASALKTVQSSRGIKVAFTLPVNPDGLDSLGLAVVKSALSAGVTISHVNVMTMDYGSGTDVGSAALSSADATASQLQSAIGGLSSAAAYQMVGVTPMIGKNDDSEDFSISDASTLAAYAKSKGIGLLAFWAIQRDEKCPSSGYGDGDRCSNDNSSTFQYSKIFQAVSK